MGTQQSSEQEPGELSLSLPSMAAHQQGEAYTLTTARAASKRALGGHKKHARHQRGDKSAQGAHSPARAVHGVFLNVHTLPPLVMERRQRFGRGERT